MRKRMERKVRIGLSVLGLLLAIVMMPGNSIRVLADEGADEAQEQPYEAAAEEQELVGTFDIADKVYKFGGWGVPAEENSAEEGPEFYGLTTEYRDELKEKILSAMSGEVITLEIDAKYNLMVDEVQAIQTEVLNENPELFYISLSDCKYSYNLTGLVTKITFGYTSHTKEDKEKLAQKLAQAASLVDADMSDVEKALILHDYLAQNCVYAIKEFTDNTLDSVPHVYDAYGALVNGYAVCQGYTEAYIALLKQVGIESGICTGAKEMNHVWNVVKIDGKWYHVDVTWDDPVWNREGRVRHQYFLLSDTEMALRGESQKHYGWTDSVDCSSTIYDASSYWWCATDSNIVHMDGKKYYVTKPSGGGLQLIERDGSATTVKYTSSLVWNVWGEDSFWTGCYSYLSRVGNYLFFNDRTKIYAMKPGDSSPQTVYTYAGGEGYIYGAMVYMDGTAKVNILQDPNAKTHDTLTATLTKPSDWKIPSVDTDTKVSAVSLDKSSLTLSVGETNKFIVTVTPSYATEKHVSWSSSDTSVVSVDSNGKATAKAVGKATITVTSIDGSKKSASCDVTVVAATIKVTSVKLNKNTLSLKEKETETLKATIEPGNASNPGVTWSSSNSDVATVDSKGKVTAKSVGQAKITATATDGSKKSDSCDVTVQSAVVKVTEVKLNKTSLSLVAGKSEKLTATVEPSDATNKGINWNTTDTSIATVDSNGKVTAVSAGTVRITATSQDGSNRSANCTVTVKILVEEIKLDETELNLEPDKEGKLKATIEPSNASNKKVLWSSSNPAVVSVDGNGNLTAKADGTATITVTAEDESGKNAVCTVTVKRKDGWNSVSGVDYWYENGVRQGYNPDDKDFRGKEIYDEASDAWYWLDNVLGGAIAKSKDVYQESLAGQWGDKDGVDEKGNPVKIGKWVRYDAEGHMVKGWCAGSGEDAVRIDSPDQADGKAIYYFDETFGTMAKGSAVIDGKTYYFNKDTGILESMGEGDVPKFGWKEIDGKFYWYEDYIRQGYDPNNPDYRGKEINDPATDDWYWLDNVQQGAKAVSKDVYQESLAGEWGDMDGVDENGNTVRIGKWVRYDAEGHMIKGWCAGKDAEAVQIKDPSQANGRDVYYFDWIFGTMAKGNCVIDGASYYFDPTTGILAK